MQAASRISAIALAAMLLPGCAARSPAAAAGAESPSTATASEQGYRATPELTSARAVRGGIELAGAASPQAAVRLASPHGPPLYATADRGGRWRIVTPASDAPRLLSLSMSDHGRRVWAVGYLFVPPGGGAVRLRSGGGSEALASPSPVPLALTIDYDARRAAATLAGVARPGESVSLAVDGVERGQARAGPDGRFVLALNAALGGGAHAFELTAAGRTERFAATLPPTAPLARSPFAASRLGPGWKVDWMTPGGGEQTTLVLAAPNAPV